MSPFSQIHMEDFVLVTKKFNCCSVVPARVVLISEIDVKIVGEVNRFLSAEQVKEQPLFFQSKTILSTTEHEKAIDFSSNKVPCESVRNLKDGFYDVLKIEKVADKSFPFMLVNVEGNVKKISMNQKLVDEFEKLKKNGLVSELTRLYIRKINKFNSCVSLKTVNM